MTEEKRYITLDELKALDDTVREDVWVPEWNAWVKIKSMSEQEATAFFQDCEAHKGDTEYANVRLLAASMESPSIGPKEYAVLKQRNWRAILRLLDQIRELSGLDELAAERAQKNSSTPQVGASSSS